MSTIKIPKEQTVHSTYVWHLKGCE